jgi:hypothetical protein
MGMKIRSNETFFADHASLTKAEIEAAHKSLIKLTAASERCLGCREVLVSDAGWEIRVEDQGIRLISYFVVRENRGTAYDPDAEWKIKGKCENCGDVFATREKYRDLDFSKPYHFTCQCTWTVAVHPDDWEYVE